MLLIKSKDRVVLCVQVSLSPVFHERLHVAAAQSRWLAFHVRAGVVAGGSTARGYGLHAVES